MQLKHAVVGGGQDDDDEDLEEEDEAALSKKPKDKLLPCIRAHKEKGDCLWYAVWYRLLQQTPEEKDYLHQRRAQLDWVPEGSNDPPPMISQLILEQQRRNGR